MSAVDLDRTDNDEESVSVSLQLRTLMRPVSIFDGEVMQLKLFLDLFESGLVGIEKADPDEAIRIAEVFADVLDRYGRDPATTGVGGAVNDAVSLRTHT